MKMTRRLWGAPAGPECTDASSPHGLGGWVRLVGGCGGASSRPPSQRDQTGAPPPSSPITDGSGAPWVAVV